jgi:protein TonB
MLDIQRRSDGSIGARTFGATWVSAILHAALFVLVVAMARHADIDSKTPDEERAPLPQLVWIGQADSGLRGGRTPNRRREPANRAERPGRDRLTVPAARPPAGERIVDREPPAQEVNIPAVPEASGLREIPGVVSEVIAVNIAPGGRSSGPGAGLDGRSGLDRGPGSGTGDRGRGSGNDLVSPEVVRQVRPNYTSPALQARVRGLVVMDAVVLPDGSVGDVKIIRSLDKTFGLDEEAVKAVKQWRFRPGRRAGDAVAMLVSVEMVFELR